MAILKHFHTDVAIPLAARHVVGRSDTCQLHIDLASVSSFHAEIAWDGQVWRLRDLGSRNGTFVSGQRLLPGQVVTLAAGAEIGFGAPESRYRLVECSPPQLMAFGPTQTLVAEDDVLCLPSAAACEAMIFRGDGERWLIETADGTRPLGDAECVTLGGQPFHVHLPGGVLATRDTEAPREEPPDDGIFELRVSRDGEHVDLCLHLRDRVRPIEARAHAFLLLALARSRVMDAARGELPESEHGWMHREDLMKELAIDDPQLLNLWVYRARQQFAQLKLRAASQIIERREGAGQLRLGLKHVRVIDT